ncbi:MAG: FAD:protein FMN transferase [Lachnospiraceae bacterium]|nr:FAD:protein FMN transferase [Lachnospiraceae bacterium]
MEEADTKTRADGAHAARFLIPVLLIVIIAYTGCAMRPEPVARQSFHFDTVCSVTIFDMENMSEKNAAEAIEAAFGQLREYERLFSRTREGTDIWKINHAGGEPVNCDARTVELIRKGLSYHALSGGRFALTVGAVTQLWDFHEGKTELPDPDVLKEAVKHIDDAGILIDGNTVMLKDPLAVIDLGAIAKGYAADGIDALLREKGVTSAVIDLGGNISCIGQKPQDGAGRKSRPFVIGIELPFSDRREIIGTTELTDETVATSGIYERFFDAGGRRYHHILDVSTGYPADTDILGISIVSSAGHSSDCDALSTICLMLGQESAMELIESMEGFEALSIGAEGEIRTTSGFDLD